MKTVYFATGNRGKYEVLKESLVRFNISLVHENMEFLEELDSPILAEIAADKVVMAYEKVRKPVIALDAGFYIPSLDGFPGTNVNPALKDLGIEGILELIQGKERFCKFKQCLAYMGLGMESPKVFESVSKGYLSEEPCGTIQHKKKAWSKLWLIFIPEGESKTLGEMTEEDYRNWRGKRNKDSIGAKFGRWYSRN